LVCGSKGAFLNKRVRGGRGKRICGRKYLLWRSSYNGGGGEGEKRTL